VLASDDRLAHEPERDPAGRALNRLEAGRFDPAVGVVQRLAKALGMPLMELLG
jgi:hypothetical protein